MKCFVYLSGRAESGIKVRVMLGTVLHNPVLFQSCCWWEGHGPCITTLPLPQPQGLSSTQGWSSMSQGLPGSLFTPHQGRGSSLGSPGFLALSWDLCFPHHRKRNSQSCVPVWKNPVWSLLGLPKVLPCQIFGLGFVLLMTVFSCSQIPIIMLFLEIH